MAADQASQAISQNTAERLVQDISDVSERLASAVPAPAPRMHRRIVGVPAESSADALLIRMLQLTLAQRSEAMMAVPRTDRATMLAQARDERPELICIAALPPSGNANARFLCRRLRSELPDANIVVLLPEDAGKRSQEAAARLREAGANAVAYDLREAAALLGQT
jgi:rhodanese-related sulfurtransferase